MWRFKLITILSMVFCINIFAQNNWQKIISNGDVIYTRGVMQLLDSNYLVLGSSNGYGDYSANAYIMKLNQSGNHIWTKWYGGSETEWFYEGTQNTDSSMIFAGYTNSFTYGGYDIYVVKTDKNGDLIWQKHFGGQDWDFAYSIKKTYDGGYIICGETYSFGSGNNDAFLLKIDANGDSLWMHTYGGMQNDMANKVIELSNQNIAFTGTTNSQGYGQEDLWVFICDNFGIAILDTVIGTTENEQGKDLVETQTNNIILTGNKFNTINNSIDISIAKIDLIGNIIWNDILGGANQESSFGVVFHPTYDNYYYIGSSNSYGQGLNDFVIYGLSEYLSFNYSNTFGTLYNEICYSAYPTFDDGLILAGDTDIGNGIRSIYLVKLNNTFVTPPAAQNINDLTSIYINAENEHIELFPNPAANLFYFRGVTTNVLNIEITDIRGKILFKDKYNSIIDCSLWPNGLYFLKIMNTDNSFQTLKLIVQH